MEFFEFVITILFLVFGFVLLINIVRSRGARQDSRESAATRKELLALRERVEALEAIVTDKRTQLAREIDSLDLPPQRRAG